MYLGKKTLNLLYIIDAISIILLIAFFVGPELLQGTALAEFMVNYRGLMVYHCIIFAVITVLLQKFHAEICVEFKSLQKRLPELENIVKNNK